MLHYNIIIKFDLNNVPKICHLKSIKESFMSFLSAKRTYFSHHTTKGNLWEPIKKTLKTCWKSLENW